MLTTVDRSLLTDTSGFVAIDKTNSIIAVSFRGSESWRNYATVLDFPLVPISICDGCVGAQGYLVAWSEVQDSVCNAVKDAAATNPQYTILVTGHSLGGAIATLGAAYLRNQGYTVDMVRLWN